MRLFRKFNRDRRRLLFVSPGPSSDHVLGCLNFGHVATVNRAALIVPGAIDYAFCADLEALEQIRSAWDRIRTFVIPDRLSINSKVSERSWAEWPGVPHDRALVFPSIPTITDRDTIDRINNPDTLACCNSMCAGLHAAGRMGYEHIWVIGCDGGMGYSSLLWHGGYGQNWDAHRARMELIASAIGCDVRFWPDRFE